MVNQILPRGNEEMRSACEAPLSRIIPELALDPKFSGIHSRIAMQERIMRKRLHPTSGGRFARRLKAMERRMNRAVFLSILAALLLLGTTLAFAQLSNKSVSASTQTGLIAFKVRDNTIGYAVRATVQTTPIRTGQAVQSPIVTDWAGRVEIYLAPGEYRFNFSAAGYRPLETHFEIMSGEKLGFIEVHLDREAPPEEERPEVIHAQERLGYALLFGFVVDSNTGQPLPNVLVRLRKIAGQATTNERGYFAFSVKVPKAPANQPKIFMGAVLDDLSFQLPGYKTLELDGVDFYPTGGAEPFQVDLKRGVGIEREDVTPVPLRNPSTIPPSHGTIPQGKLTEPSMQNAQAAAAALRRPCLRIRG